MEEKWKIQLSREPKLANELTSLHVTRAELLPVVVEAALPDGHNFPRGNSFPGQARELFKVPFAQGVRAEMMGEQG